MTLRKAVRIPLLAVLLAANALGLQGWTGTHRAHLSVDLLAHEAHHTSKRVPVIVHGAPAEVGAIAARHNLTIVRQLEDSAVLAVNSTERETPVLRAARSEPATQARANPSPRRSSGVNTPPICTMSGITAL